MKSPFYFIVKPFKGKRYNNTKSISGIEFITSSSEEDYTVANRKGIVTEIPLNYKGPIKIGDILLVHHNVFRRWHNQHGIEKNSRSYIDEETYLVQPDQIFLYKNTEWQAQKGYCFVAPVKSTNELNVDKEKPLVGIVKHTDGTVNKGDLVGFRPSSEYEFIIDGQKLYRVLSNFITIKYEYQGDEEEYNPSWA